MCKQQVYRVNFTQHLKNKLLCNYKEIIPIKRASEKIE